MFLDFCLKVSILLSAWSSTKCAGLPDGVFHMECHDRYFMLAVDISLAGEEPHFEAVDETGAFHISEQYAAKCGYSVSVLPLQGLVELRASYFSCHTGNQNDETFTFNFNLMVTDEGNETLYALNKTCSPMLPWSPREVTCDVNYMEVSVRSELGCPSGTKKDDWNALKSAHGSTTSDWQVMFQIEEEQLPAMNLSEARRRGYTFLLTDGRLVFRTPYGQPESFRTEENGVPAEVVQATLFSRQSWVVLMIDLMAACSLYEGSYDSRGYMVWKTPEMLYPSLDGSKLSMGLNGELVAQPIAEERGSVIEKHNATLQISIPNDAEGAFRKSFVTGDLYKFYVFNLYLEQVFKDEDNVETRVRSFKDLATPPLPHPVFTENQTVLEDRVFIVYLGDLPEDVELAAVHLNEHEFLHPFTNASSHMITKVVHPNNTHGYTLKVPFDDPVVTQQLSKKNKTLQYVLNINYTLSVLPENESFHHLTSIVALFTDVSPPALEAVCSESGISFRLEHRPFDYLWYLTVGSELLTPELAAQHGYIMSNDSQSLQLHVPLYTHGYEYQDVTLYGFSGTFEILVQDRETSEVHSSSAKTCPFTSSEFIMCSTDGRMTVVADVSLVAPSGGRAGKTHLRDQHCGPKETDGNRALFSFPLNSCGSSVKLYRDNVTYLNEISHKGAISNTSDRVTVQCIYPLEGLHRLFSVFRFDSDTVGHGSIIHLIEPTGLHSPTIKPTTARQTTPAAKRPAALPAIHPPARYIKVNRFQKYLIGKRKGAAGHQQTKVEPAQI